MRRPSLLAITRTTLDLVLVGLVALALVALVVARGLPALGHETIVIKGRSMEPTIPIGSVIVLERVAASWVAPGDVVTITVPERGTRYTHRVLEVVERDDGRWLRTKGDNNATADPAIVPVGWTTGRVTTWVPGLGYLLHLLSTVPGMLAFLSASLTLYLAARLVEDLEWDAGAERPDGPTPDREPTPDRRPTPATDRAPAERATELTAEATAARVIPDRADRDRAARREEVVRSAQRARRRRLATEHRGARG